MMGPGGRPMRQTEQTNVAVVCPFGCTPVMVMHQMPPPG